MTEHEIRADEVKPGDYIAGLGRVQSRSEGNGRVNLRGEDWRIWLIPAHRVTVLR